MFFVVIHPRVAGDVKHPGPEAAVVAKRVAILQHPEKDILNQILRRRPVAGYADEEVEESAMIPIEKFAQSFDVAVADGHHQALVVFRHPVSNNRGCTKKLQENYGFRRGPELARSVVK